MKRVLSALLLAITLPGCAMSPVLETYSTNSAALDPEAQATVWADNTSTAAAMITKVDGKRMPSRRGGGYPYSVAVSPGVHTLAVLIQDHSPANPFAWKSANLEQQIKVEAGHAYALSFESSSDGRRVHVELLDLGHGKICRHEVTGTMRKGYVPVSLKCS